MLKKIYKIIFMILLYDQDFTKLKRILKKEMLNKMIFTSINYRKENWKLSNQSVFSDYKKSKV